MKKVFVIEWDYMGSTASIGGLRPEHLRKILKKEGISHLKITEFPFVLLKVEACGRCGGDFINTRFYRSGELLCPFCDKPVQSEVERELLELLPKPFPELPDYPASGQELVIKNLKVRVHNETVAEIRGIIEKWCKEDK